MNDFTNDELILISNALIQAIQSNNEAAKLTVSRVAVDAIRRSNATLAALNSKVCNLIQED